MSGGTKSAGDRICSDTGLVVTVYVLGAAYRISVDKDRPTAGDMALCGSF